MQEQDPSDSADVVIMGREAGPHGRCSRVGMGRHPRTAGGAGGRGKFAGGLSWVHGAAAVLVFSGMCVDVCTGGTKAGVGEMDGVLHESWRWRQVVLGVILFKKCQFYLRMPLGKQ